MRAPLFFLLATVAFVSASCGPTVDLTKGLQVAVVSSGWFDAGIVNNQNKLVPSVTFTLTNASDQKLPVLQVMASFRRVNENEEWGNAFLAATGPEALAPGATTKPLTARSQLGYTGSNQSRQEMMQSSHFVDAKVQLFAKYGSIQWVKVGEYPIERNLITK
jgi:hypothetical protein